MKRIPDSIKQQAAYWLPVCPVHLIADRDTLLLAPTEGLDLSVIEANALAEAFNQHFAEDSYQLYIHSEQEWFLGSKQAFDLGLPTLEKAIGMNLRDAWQNGKTASVWRKLLNEAQMLWFTHEVNQQRESVGKLPINGLWVVQPVSFITWMRSLWASD